MGVLIMLRHVTNLIGHKVSQFRFFLGYSSYVTVAFCTVIVVVAPSAAHVYLGDSGLDMW